MTLYSIKEATEKIGVARSTLLYYEKLGLIKPERHPENRYRLYSEAAINRLIILRQIQKAGLSLKECHRFMEGKLNPALIRQRMQDLEGQIEDLRQAGAVLRALLNRTDEETPSLKPTDNSLKPWHMAFEKQSAEAHTIWLMQQGFSEKETIHIRWVSRDMENHNDYMENFLAVFSQMKRQGPGSETSTLRSFNQIKADPPIQEILDVGCGKGATSLLLAKSTKAQVTALDNHQPFLDHLDSESKRQGLERQITTVNGSMTALPFEKEHFDLIWSEGAAYIMGFEKALADWKPYLKNGGHLFISEAVWAKAQRSAECEAFWEREYPAITDLETRIKQTEEAGYRVIDSFLLPLNDWLTFYDDMEAQLKMAITQYGPHPAFEDMQQEMDLFRNYGEEYSYGCLLLKKI
ncbi:methyltransferase domain-containing protein [bacterium]|nr:methyltransferase domain-containing protein [bacterium]